MTLPVLVTSIAAATVAQAALQAGMGTGDSQRVELRTLTSSETTFVYKAPGNLIDDGGFHKECELLGWKGLTLARRASVAHGTATLQQYYIPDDAFRDASWYSGNPYTWVKMQESDLDGSNVYKVEKRWDSTTGCYFVAWLPISLNGAERLQQAINTGDSTNWGQHLDDDVRPDELARNDDYLVTEGDKTVVDKLGEMLEAFMKDPVKFVAGNPLFSVGIVAVGVFAAFKIFSSANVLSGLRNMQRRF